MSAPAYTNDQGGGRRLCIWAERNILSGVSRSVNVPHKPYDSEAQNMAADTPSWFVKLFYVVCGQIWKASEQNSLWKTTVLPYMHHNIHQETSFPFKLNMLHFPAVLLDKWSWLVKSQQRRFRKYKSLGGAQNILQRGLYQPIIPKKSSSYKIQIQKYKIQNTNHLVVRRIFCNVVSINWSFRTNPHHSSSHLLYSNVYSYNLWSLTRIEKLKQYNTWLCQARKAWVKMHGR